MHEIEALSSQATPFLRSRVLLVGIEGVGALDLVASIFRRRGHQVEIDPTAAEELSTIDAYDLVVIELDVRKPDVLLFPGWLRQISTVPLLVLIPMTARSQGIRALELGADCFVALPFDRRELVARSEALIRRYRQAFEPQ